MFQNYLNLILMNPILASSLPVKKFLDPENYATPFQGWSLSILLLFVIYYCHHHHHITGLLFPGTSPLVPVMNPMPQAPIVALSL
jgi:hypothetical protein